MGPTSSTERFEVQVRSTLFLSLYCTFLGQRLSGCIAVFMLHIKVVSSLSVLCKGKK